MNIEGNPSVRDATTLAGRTDRTPLTTPETPTQLLRNSAAVWLAVMLVWSVMDLLMMVTPAGGRVVHPDSWVTHVAFTLVGFIPLWCMHRTGFPAGWDTRIAPASRFAWPALVGVAFAIAQILLDRTTRASEVLAEKLGESFNVAFPGSLWVYTGGAIVWEFIFLLLPVPVLLWLISSVLLRGRRQTVTFWGLAVLSSALEPIMQGGRMFSVADGTLGPGVFAAYAIHAFTFNFAAAAFFRRSGLLAPILVRFTYYLVWHVGYGALTS